MGDVREKSLTAQLTDRDREVLDTLLLRLPALTLEQVARTWWHSSSQPKRVARDRLNKLVCSGFLLTELVMAHPELQLDEPLCRWQPGGAEPDFQTLATTLKARFKEPLVQTRLYVATSRAAKFFGGYGGLFPAPSERSHDVSLAGVYLAKVRSGLRPKHWDSEKLLYAARRRKQQRLPDAFCRHPKPHFVEFGGQYGHPKLQAFHGYCALRRTPYELW